MQRHYNTYSLSKERLYSALYTITLPHGVLVCENTDTLEDLDVKYISFTFIADSEETTLDLTPARWQARWSITVCFVEQTKSFVAQYMEYVLMRLSEEYGIWRASSMRDLSDAQASCLSIDVYVDSTRIDLSGTP